MRAIKDVQLVIVVWAVVCVSLTYGADDDCNDETRGACPPENIEPVPKGDDGTDPLPGTGDLGRELDETDSKETDPAPKDPFKCHGQTYDPKSQTCCGGKITGISSLHNSNIKCCGTVAFDNSRMVCCRMNRPQRINKRRAFVGCCGNNVIDTGIKVCCSGKPFAKAAANRCCAADGYNKNHSICCKRGNRLINAPGNRCCGKTPFFNSDESKFCCDNNLVTRSGKGPRRCCGRMIYNPKLGQCHIGRVSKKKPTNGKDNMVPAHDPNVIPDNEDFFFDFCCGNSRFSVRKSTSIRCCNDVPYINTLQKCCDGTLNELH